MGSRFGPVASLLRGGRQAGHQLSLARGRFGPGGAARGACPGEPGHRDIQKRQQQVEFRARPACGGAFGQGQRQLPVKAGQRIQDRHQPGIKPQPVARQKLQRRPGRAPGKRRKRARIGRKFGARLFQNHCAQCHGSDARGAKGFPNLTDDDWLWGGSAEQILATIVDGRQAAMPALGAAIGGDVGVTEVAAYVQSLSGIKADPALAEAGKAKYAGVCAACHGADGKGNPILGAPNLTDDTWLYGSDFATISEGIRNGRNGMMPAHGPIIGETRSRLVGAYVWTISHGKDAEPPDAP